MFGTNFIAKFTQALFLATVSLTHNVMSERKKVKQTFKIVGLAKINNDCSEPFVLYWWYSCGTFYQTAWRQPGIASIIFHST